MKFQVVLSLRVEAESGDEAFDLGVAAAEHLIDTFNDNDSIDPLVFITVEPNGTH